MTNEFDISQLKDNHFNLSIVGKTNSGKSTLLYYILNLIKEDYKFIYFVTTNDIFQKNCILHNFIWPNHIKVVNNNNQIPGLLDKLYNWTYNISDTTDKYKSLIIFDDIGDYLNGKLYKTITKSRHINLSMIFLLHDMLTIAKNEREQLTYRIFTHLTDVKRDLDIKSTNVANDISLFVKNITENENGQKKYMLFDDKLTSKYIIIPQSFIDNLYQNKINTLVYQESQFKSELIKNIIENVNNKYNELNE